MKTDFTVKIFTEKVQRGVWEWCVENEQKQLLGAGYCNTKKSAISDATIFLNDLHSAEPRLEGEGLLA